MTVAPGKDKNRHGTEGDRRCRLLAVHVGHVGHHQHIGQAIIAIDNFNIHRHLFFTFCFCFLKPSLFGFPSPPSSPNSELNDNGDGGGDDHGNNTTELCLRSSLHSQPRLPTSPPSHTPTLICNNDNRQTAPSNGNHAQRLHHHGSVHYSRMSFILTLLPNQHPDPFLLPTGFPLTMRNPPLGPPRSQ